MISFTIHGNLKKTHEFLERALNLLGIGELDKYGKEGVEALKAATPYDTGRTASGWSYEITYEKNVIRIKWNNDHIEDGCNIAILLQYGHLSRDGYWVEGIDYINPALRPVFEKIADSAWKEVYYESDNR